MVAATAAAAGTLMFLQVDFLVNLARLLFGVRGSLASALLVLGAAVAVAAVAAPRVCAGLGGWLRHLPVAGATHRRAAAAAIAVAEAPLLAFLALLVLAARSRPGPAGKRRRMSSSRRADESSRAAARGRSPGEALWAPETTRSRREVSHVYYILWFTPLTKCPGQITLDGGTKASRAPDRTLRRHGGGDGASAVAPGAGSARDFLSRIRIRVLQACAVGVFRSFPS
jgi:hypothetical protein